MFESYRLIFTRATALFSLTGLVARLPISMVGLGLVLLFYVLQTGVVWWLAGPWWALLYVATLPDATEFGWLLDAMQVQRPFTLAVHVHALDRLRERSPGRLGGAMVGATGGAPGGRGGTGSRCPCADLRESARRRRGRTPGVGAGPPGARDGPAATFTSSAAPSRVAGRNSQAGTRVSS